MLNESSRFNSDDPLRSLSFFFCFLFVRCFVLFCFVYFFFTYIQLFFVVVIFYGYISVVVVVTTIKQVPINVYASTLTRRENRFAREKSCLKSLDVAYFD